MSGRMLVGRGARSGDAIAIAHSGRARRARLCGRMSTTRKGSRKPGRPQATRIERRRAAIERRRAISRAAITEQVRARRRRRARLRWASAVGVLVVVALAVVIIWRRGDGDDGPSAALNAERVDSDGQPLGITEPRPAYSITYRVETFSGSAVDVTTETTRVRRPFDAHISSLEGEPPGAAPQWSVTATLGLYGNSTGTSAVEANAGAPAAALGDPRLDATLDDLVSDGMFVLGERRQLLGRECQVYRTGLPLENPGVAAPTEGDYAEICVDAAGLMLEEVYVSAGEVLQHRTAVSVDGLYEPADADFAIDAEPAGVDAGGRDLEEIDAAAAPVAGYWAFTDPPDGYEHVGRYLLREQGDTADEPIESYIDVYADGPDTIIVRQGPVAAQPPGDVTSAPSTESAALGSIQTLTTAGGTTVLAHPAEPADWFVHVSGTAPRADLLTVVEALGVTS